jgi:hypothetical protein
LLIREPSVEHYRDHYTELFLASYDRLPDGHKERVEDLAMYVVWRCERNRPLGDHHQHNLYIVALPPFVDVSKIRLLYADEANERRVTFHSLSLTGPRYRILER